LLLIFPWIITAISIILSARFEQVKETIQVIAVLLLNYRGPKEEVPKHDFGHYRLSEEHADGTNQLLMCDFLLDI